MKNLAKAVLEVMKEVKGIDKSLTVGSGNHSYKGVSDQVVKKTIGDAMAKNGLVILPISIEPKTIVNRWEEKTNYGLKQKQSVFTEATTKYLLMHESGESQEIAGYGHGVDTQDKGAGKATTYALKYALLYMFLVPTGAIDDSDTTHSNDIAEPVKVVTPKAKDMKWLVINSKEWDNVVEGITRDKIKSIDDIAKHYKIRPEVVVELDKLLK